MKVDLPTYLFPYACFACRRSFRRAYEPGLPNRKCPNCGGESIALNRKFKAPASDDVEQWKKVRFLVEHGFRFQSVYENKETVPYPASLREAKAFVERYRSQARMAADVHGDGGKLSRELAKVWQGRARGLTELSRAASQTLWRAVIDADHRHYMLLPKPRGP